MANNHTEVQLLIDAIKHMKTGDILPYSLGRSVESFDVSDVAMAAIKHCRGD